MFHTRKKRIDELFRIISKKIRNNETEKKEIQLRKLLEKRSCGFFLCFIFLDCILAHSDIMIHEYSHIFRYITISKIFQSPRVWFALKWKHGKSMYLMLLRKLDQIPKNRMCWYCITFNIFSLEKYFAFNDHFPRKCLSITILSLRRRRKHIF